MRRLVCVALVFASFIAAPRAQGPTAKVGGGAMVTGLGLLDESGRPTMSPGITGWAEVYAKPGLAVEGRVSWFPRKEFPDHGTQGGRSLAIFGGVRGTLIETRRIRVQGSMSSGVLRFSDTISILPAAVQPQGGRTHFSMALGGSLELLPDSKWAPRVDLLHTLYVVPGVPSAAIYGTVADTYQLSAGVRYRPTQLRVGPMPVPKSRFQVGMHMAYSGAAFVLGPEPQHNGGVGAFLSCRLTTYLYLDGAVSRIAGATDVRTPWEGGRVAQGLIGVKFGVMRDGVGLYLKARTGVNSHGTASKGRDAVQRFGRSNVGAVDVGGVLELHHPSRMFFRLDASSLTSLYGSRTILVDGVVLPQAGQPSRQSIQLTVGAGWAF